MKDQTCNQTCNQFATEYITKQAAIDAFNTDEKNMITVVGMENAMILGKYLNRVLNKIKQLPSAQPTFDARDTQYNLPIGTDCISRQAAIRWVKTECNPYGKPTLEFESGKRVIEHLENMPPAQPEPKRGRWERHYSRPNVYADLFWHCSECGYKDSENYAPVYHHFCPNCGTDMRQREEGET